jgi:hypothetical protein
LAWRVVADGQPSFSRSSFLLSPSSRLPCQWLQNKTQQLIIATIIINTDEQTNNVNEFYHHRSIESTELVEV